MLQAVTFGAFAQGGGTRRSFTEDETSGQYIEPGGGGRMIACKAGWPTWKSAAGTAAIALRGCGAAERLDPKAGTAPDLQPM